MKKFLLLVITMIPMMVFAETVTINGINYNLFAKGNIAEVAKNSRNKESVIIIPPIVTYNEQQYTVVTIIENAFGSSNMTSLEIPNTVTSIGWQAFHTCSNLESVKIGSGVSSMGGDIFRGCHNLSSIIVSTDNKFYDSRNDCNAIIETNTNTLLFASNNTTIPNTVTSINSEAFEGLNKITTLDIPHSVKSIERWGIARCAKLEKVTIGDGMETIMDQAFEYDTNLKTIIIGKGIKQIDWGAFGECPNIEDIYIYADRLPQTHTGTFNNSHINFSTLHVPSSLIEQYKNNEPWKNFKEIVAIDKPTQEKKKCEMPSISYEKGQLKMSCITEEVEYVTEITNSDIRKYYDATITLTASYNISVYATKSGYDNSDVATATLCWIDVEPKAEGIVNGVASVRSYGVMIQTSEGFFNISGLEVGTPISVYNTAGQMVGSAKAISETTIVNTTLRNGEIGIVKIGDKSVKVLMK